MAVPLMTDAFETGPVVLVVASMFWDFGSWSLKTLRRPFGQLLRAACSVGVWV